MTQHDEARVTGHEEGRASEHPKGPASGGGGWLLFFAGLVVTAVITWLIWPTLIYSQKNQPFSFNHAIHTVKSGMACDECHKFTAEGRFQGIPALEECLMCHTWSSRQNEANEAETAFLEEFVTKDDRIKKSADWYVYSGQPDCVYFSHIAHVKNGGISCEECHGDHGKTTGLRPFYQNRLTKYSREVWEKMKMTDCADCHTKSGKPENNACFVCHK